MDTYKKNIVALREMQEAALAKFRETGNKDFRRKAIEYGAAKSKLRALILKRQEYGIRNMELGIRN